MYASPTHYVGKAPQSSLERQYIIDYLAVRGYSLKDLKILPKEKADELMTVACRYASLKLAEIESRSKFLHKIHYEG